MVNSRNESGNRMITHPPHSRGKWLLSLAASILLIVLLAFNAFPVVGEKAPSFTLEDINGNKVSLSDFHGRVVIVDFWATWCHACEESSPELEWLHRKYKDKGVAVLGISLDAGSDAVEKVRAFARRLDLNYPMLMGNDDLARAYRMQGIPTTYILDKDHVIVKRYVGALPQLGDIMAAEIEKLL
jgi:peroxiredoxin